MHPEYFALPPIARDPEKAKALMAEAGHADTELELISLDDDFNRNTCDAVAAQMRDAGLNVKRTVLPGNTFWNNWTGYPFSSTEWNMRPLGVQVYNLAYRTGVPWNETAFANQEFDDLLTQAYAIADADQRRGFDGQDGEDHPGFGDHRAALLALDLPAHDPGRERPRDASDFRDPPGTDLAGHLIALPRHPSRRLRRAGKPRQQPTRPG